MRGVLLILALAPPVALAQDYYGAIAYSPSKKANGWAYNHATRKGAESAALGNCRKLAADCKTLVWFVNACGSLATGPRGYGSAWGSTQAAADEEALKLCGQHSPGCSVARRVCTAGRK